MYERMLDKSMEPTLAEIKAQLGDASFAHLTELEKYLQSHYELIRALRFPFGNSYGWGYKYSHKATHLCYAFFEAQAFTVTLQISDKQAPTIEAMLSTLSPQAQELWVQRYPCGEHGGWLHYRVLADADLADIYKLIAAKKAPIQKP